MPGLAPITGMLRAMPYQEPEFAPWDGRRVPLTFIAGYLGAGKTTLINEVLARTDRPIAVFVNDVGEVNLDARLIRRRHGDTIELTDGCVCCSLSDGFGAAFDQLRTRVEPPDHVLVELSGVADPARVRPWGRSAGFVLDGVVTVVDAVRAASLAADPLVGAAVRAQLAAADLVVLTKLDLASAAEATAARELVGPDRALIQTGPAGVLPAAAAVVGLGGRRPGGVTDVPPVSLFDHHEVVSIPFPDIADAGALEAWVEALDPTVVRAKGIASGPNGRRWLVQRVGRHGVVSDLPRAEWSAPTDLVVIRLRRHEP